MLKRKFNILRHTSRERFLCNLASNGFLNALVRRSKRTIRFRDIVYLWNGQIQVCNADLDGYRFGGSNWCCSPLKYALTKTFAVYHF